MNEIVVIDLFGEKFRFKPDGQVKDPQGVANCLKKYIQAAEQLLSDKRTGRDKVAILLLAAMNLSKDFHELKMQNSELEKLVNDGISS